MANTTLTISSKNYSSWSLRGWLLTRLSGLPFEEIVMPIDDPAARAELLRDQQVIAGIGRTWVDEILHAAKLSPFKRGDDLSEREAKALREAMIFELGRVLDVYEPAANRIANTVAINFVTERERVIRQQQEAIRELSTPVLQVRERLLILPIIGVIDPQRARQLTEQLLHGIRATRGKVVVIDLTGVAAMDSSIANHLVQTVEASRLLGATVIVTGLSPAIAQTLVNIGVDLGKMNTVGDLQGGIEEAERLLGYRVALIPVGEEAESRMSG